MAPKTPDLTVPKVPETWDTDADILTWNWNDIPTLPPFTLADGSDPAQQQTITRVCYNAQALYTRFDCTDNDIWGTFSQRDDPIYDEEVVEIFLGAGEVDLVHYYEFEVSPNGILLDAKIYNPTSQRAELEVDLTWNCPGIRWQAGRNSTAQHWWAVLVIPWAGVAPPGDTSPIWRANFYRIERPHNGPAEFSCWSPTMTDPADFHKPAYFGTLHLEEIP